MSLSPTPLNPQQITLTNQYRFGNTVQKKSQSNKDLKEQLKKYLYKQYDIVLPDTVKEFEANRSEIFDYDAYGEELELECYELCRLYYSLTVPKGYFAKFEQDDKIKVVPMAFWYSKHRLCHVWNWRKSQIIRNKYFHYLKEASEAIKDYKGISPEIVNQMDLKTQIKEGFFTERKIIDYYVPIHLVLTVPHKNGLFKDKKFYAKELVELYNRLRKTEFWQQNIYGGEYGVEVKKSKTAGLHIHIHSFTLQNPNISVNDCREGIANEWRKLTGNKSLYDGIWYETLYVREKVDGVTKKDYIKPGDPVEKYLKGVMECIKYHFKPDCIQIEGARRGNYDFKLIQEILSNTKNLRMYSRFGAFYKEKDLNFNNLEKEKDTEKIDEKDLDSVIEELNGSAAVAESNIINPFTMQQSIRAEYTILIGSILKMKFHTAFAPEPYSIYNINLNKFQETPPFALKTLFYLDATKQLDKFIHLHNLTITDNAT